MTDNTNIRLELGMDEANFTFRKQIKMVLRRDVDKRRNLRKCYTHTQMVGKRPSSSAGFESADFGPRGEHYTPRPKRPTFF